MQLASALVVFALALCLAPCSALAEAPVADTPDVPDPPGGGALRPEGELSQVVGSVSSGSVSSVAASPDGALLAFREEGGEAEAPQELQADARHSGGREKPLSDEVRSGDSGDPGDPQGFQSPATPSAPQGVPGQSSLLSRGGSSDFPLEGDAVVPGDGGARGESPSEDGTSSGLWDLEDSRHPGDSGNPEGRLLDDDLWIGGKKASPGSLARLVSRGVVYDPETRTLVLKAGCRLAGGDSADEREAAAIYFEDAAHGDEGVVFTIRLEGDATLAGGDLGGLGGRACGLYVRGTLRILGNALLEVMGGNAPGGSSYGVWASRALTVADGAWVKAAAGRCAGTGESIGIGTGSGLVVDRGKVDAAGGTSALRDSGGNAFAFNGTACVVGTDESGEGLVSRDPSDVASGVDAARYLRMGYYVVGLDPNGGTCAIAELHTNAFGEIENGTLPEASRKGYSFKGWYTQREGGTKLEDVQGHAYGLTAQANALRAIPGDQRAYAHWEPIDYVIRYILNDLVASSVLNNNPVYYNIESGDIVLAQPSASGYTFTGWTWSGSEDPRLVVTIPGGSTGDVTFTAHWREQGGGGAGLGGTALGAGAVQLASLASAVVGGSSAFKMPARTGDDAPPLPLAVVLPLLLALGATWRKGPHRPVRPVR